LYRETAHGFLEINDVVYGGSMMNIGKILWVLFFSTLTVSLAVGEPAKGDDSPEMERPTTVKSIMETVVIPQSEILWRPGDPKTEKDWLRLENAAIAIQVASAMLNVPSTELSDQQYQRLPVWKTLSNEMRAASIVTLASIRSRDLDALIAAGNDLYTPCEACHRATYQKENQ
jgi:hypothetical protein